MSEWSRLEIAAVIGEYENRLDTRIGQTMSDDELGHFFLIEKLVERVAEVA